MDRVGKIAEAGGDPFVETAILKATWLLLFTVRTVEDIAYEIGFDDPAYFSRRFRERTGEAPAAWRRKQLRG